MKKTFFIFLIILFVSTILAFSIRGNVGNPSKGELNQSSWKDDGPFELSPDRGRFALLYSVVEDQSFFFDLPLAQFATPDLGFKNGNYVSLFAPGVSFVLIPGYVLGKQFGISQVGTFAVVSLFAMINVFLIRTIAIKLRANPLAATIGAFTFLFASPAFAYAVSLYQHHLSTFLVLSCVYILISTTSLWMLTLVWFLIAFSIPLDYPNLIFMVPVGLFALGRMIFVVKEKNKNIVTFKMAGIFTFFAAVLPLGFFLWFNQISYNNPFQLSGTVEAVKEIDSNGNPIHTKEIEIPSRGNQGNQSRNFIKFFNTRNLLNGFYTHFLSPDRGIIWFAPVILLGIFGIPGLYKRNPKIVALLLGIVGSNILLYSMWGDPYGGWAFGSRYLIPTYAVMTIFLSFALTLLKKNILFLLFFFIVLLYSVSVNTLGAITTNRNPPKVEALGLEKLSGKEEKYTYERNYDFLINSGSKSFIWNSFARPFIDAKTYYMYLTSTIVSVIFLLTIRLWLLRNRKEKYDSN